MCSLCVCVLWALFSWCILTYIVYFSNLHSISGDLWWSMGSVAGQSNPGSGPRRFTADRAVNYLLQWRRKITQRAHKFSAQQFKGQPLVHYSPAWPGAGPERLSTRTVLWFHIWMSWQNVFCQSHCSFFTCGLNLSQGVAEEKWKMSSESGAKNMSVVLDTVCRLLKDGRDEGLSLCFHTTVTSAMN